MTTPHDGVNLQMIARRAMIERGFEPDFPGAALAELATINGPATHDAAARDLRAMLWCSIDNDDSRDLDQLTFAETAADGAVKVYVAIADVDALVAPASPLDRHAAHNTTSVYTAVHVFAMLPERLSTDLSSLGEAADRMAVVIEMLVARDGSLGDASLYRALVRNQAKLAYDSVSAWLEGSGPLPAVAAATSGLARQLRLQDEVAQRMRALRFSHGALTLEVLQPRFVTADRPLADLREERRGRARALIEDFMIAANGATARFLAAHGRPAIRRVVRAPKRWDRIVSLARASGSQLPATPDAKALDAFLEARRRSDPSHFPDLSLAVVKLLGAGEYLLEEPGQPPIGHFGLAVRDYSHSTAPNRRFPDLLTQRLVKALLAHEAAPYSPDDLRRLAAHCTAQEDAANKVERRVMKSASAQFVHSRIGEVFDALVTGAAAKGTWVRTLKPPVEGKLMGDSAGIDVGDRVRVRLVRVDVERGFIDFTTA